MIRLPGHRQRKERILDAQTNGRGGQRGVLSGGSWRHGGARSVVAYGLASWDAPAFYDARAGARCGAASRRAGSPRTGVLGFRRGGSWNTGAGRPSRPSGRRRAVPVRPKPHVRGGALGHHRAGPDAWTTGTARLRRGLLGHGRLLRPLLRGTDPERPVRCPIRSLPTRRAGVVATTASVEARP